MENKILLKKDIGKLYNALVKDYTFYAPVNEKGNVAFRKIENPEDIDLDFLNSKVPPKEILFPETEVLFEYRYEGKEVIIEDRKDLEEKKIIFGIRPCDAHSFMLFANFFSFHGDCKDEIYLTKRENTVLIGMGCNSPRQTCFCTSVGGNPFNKEDVDVFLVDLGDKYLVEIISEKGNSIFQKFTWLGKPNDDDLKKAEELAKIAEESISTDLDVDKIVSNLDKNFVHPIWREISESCIGCGSCTFLCPTCTCFDVIDEKDNYHDRGRRIRIWDSCQSCLYTLETSGHNPRPTKIERCRNRIMHKFSYYPKNYGLIGCVGCGRCVNVCPANNDLRIILKKIETIES